MGRKQKPTSGYEQWSPEQQRELLKLLANEANNSGQKPDTSFPRHVVVEKLLPALNSKLGCNKTYDHYLCKMKVLKKNYKRIAELMAYNSRFRWDPITCRIAAPEEVWEKYSAVNKEAADYYKQKIIESFDDMMIVFGSSCKLVANARSISAAVMDKKEKAAKSHDKEDEEVAERDNASGMQAPSEEPASHASSSLMQRKRRAEEASSSPRRVRKDTGVNDAIADGLAKIATELRSISANAWDKEWLDALDEIPDLEEELHFNACDILNTPQLRARFASWDVERRRRFLIWKSRQN